MYTVDNPMLVGIDVAKDDFVVALRHLESRTWTFSVDVKGLDQFESFVADLGGFGDSIVFGLEASGPYSSLLVGWLLAHHARVSLLNALQVYRYRRARSLRNTKTDAIDAALIARYMDDVPEALVRIETNDDLAALAAEYESVTVDVARLKNQIRQQVYVLFNELSSGSALFSKRMLRLFQAFPSARAIAHAEQRALEKVWANGRGRASSHSLDEIVQQAKQSISQPSPSREAVLRSKINRLLFLLDDQSSLRRELRQAVYDRDPETFDLLTSVPGLGEVTVSLFLAQVRSLDRFAGHKQLTAFAGLDPNTYESGQYAAPSHISKRGSPHLRRVLYQMAQSVRRYSTTFQLYYAQLRDRGKPYRVAIIACANKLIRIIMALYTSKTLFRDALLTPTT